MLARLVMTRCCCAKTPQRCPCLGGTLTTAHSITVSGTVTDPNSRWPSAQDMDGTFGPPLDATVVDDCVTGTNLSNTVGNLQFFRSWTIWFIRSTTFAGFSFPAGEKAAAFLQQDQTLAFSVVRTTASLYKVLTDVNGFVDCSLSLSGFTYNGQITQLFGDLFPPPEDPLFDASSATITYT